MVLFNAVNRHALFSQLPLLTCPCHLYAVGLFQLPEDRIGPIIFGHRPADVPFWRRSRFWVDLPTLSRPS